MWASIFRLSRPMLRHKETSVHLSPFPARDLISALPAQGRKARDFVAKTRKSKKTLEIHEFYVFRSTSGSLPALCVECSTDDAVMVAPEQAAAIVQVPVRSIYRLAELGAIHHHERPDGSLIICLKSLRADAEIGEQ